MDSALHISARRDHTDEFWHLGSKRGSATANSEFIATARNLALEKKHVPSLDDVLEHSPSIAKEKIRIATLHCGLEAVIPTHGLLTGNRIEIHMHSHHKDVIKYEDVARLARETADKKMPLGLRLTQLWRDVSRDELAAHFLRKKMNGKYFISAPNNVLPLSHLTGKKFEGTAFFDEGVVKTSATRKFQRGDHTGSFNYKIEVSPHMEFRTVALSYQFRRDDLMASLNLRTRRDGNAYIGMVNGVSAKGEDRTEFTFRDDGTLASAKVHEARTTSSGKLQTTYFITTKKRKNVADPGSPGLFADEKVICDVMETIERYETHRPCLDYSATLYSLGQAFSAEEIDTEKLESFAHLKFA